MVSTNDVSNQCLKGVISASTRLGLENHSSWSRTDATLQRGHPRSDAWCRLTMPVSRPLACSVVPRHSCGISFDHFWPRFSAGGLFNHTHAFVVGSPLGIGCK